MIIREHEEIKSGLDEKKDTMPLFEVENKVEYPVDGEVFVTRHTLSVQIKKDKEQ